MSDLKGRIRLADFLEVICDTDGKWFRRMPKHIQRQLDAECDNQTEGTGK